MHLKFEPAINQHKQEVSVYRRRFPIRQIATDYQQSLYVATSTLEIAASTFTRCIHLSLISNRSRILSSSLKHVWTEHTRLIFVNGAKNLTQNSLNLFVTTIQNKYL